MKRTHNRYYIIWTPLLACEFRQLGYLTDSNYIKTKREALKKAKELKLKYPEARLRIYQERQPVLVHSVG